MLAKIAAVAFAVLTLTRPSKLLARLAWQAQCFQCTELEYLRSALTDRARYELLTQRVKELKLS